MVTTTQAETAITFKSYNSFEDIDFVKTTWLTMLNKCQHSYFTSWGWISTWIKSLPANLDVQFIVAYREQEPVVAFFIGSKKRNKHGFLPSRLISLNSTADPYFDELYIEYNSILFDPSIPFIKDNLLSFLKSLIWDELILPGVSSDFISEINLPVDNSTNDCYMIVDETVNAYFVEMRKIREAGMDFYQLLSANKRSQIRRSIKQYELEGAIQIHEAASAEEALAMLDSLAILHQREWQKKGKTGAFSNKYLFQFHKNLIRDRFDSNEIQMLHIFNEKMTLGYLYNFVYRGHVFFYQSGFNYLVENIYRPGLVSHYYAIMLNARKNMDIYDFLAGDSAYKSSLSTDSIPMYWIRIESSRNRLKLEQNIKKIKHKLEQIPELKNTLMRIIKSEHFRKN